MLPKKQRLTALLLKKLSKERVSFVRTPLFTLRFGALLRELGPRSKFSVTVSKKELALAVKRNSARRTLYRAVQELYPELKPGVFGIFMVKGDIQIMAYERVREEVKKALKDAGLFS